MIILNKRIKFQQKTKTSKLVGLAPNFRFSHHFVGRFSFSQGLIAIIMLGTVYSTEAWAASPKKKSSEDDFWSTSTVRNPALEAKKNKAEDTAQSSSDWGKSHIAFRPTAGIHKKLSPIVGDIMETYSEWYQKDPNLKGKIVLSFSIKNTGEMQWLRVETSSIQNSIFVDYVLTEFRKCQFKRAAPNTKPFFVKYPIIFKPAEL